MNYQNKEVPSPQLKEALVTATVRHGVAGIVEKMGLSWSIVMAASHGLPVASQHLPVLTAKLSTLGFYKETV